MVENSSSPFFIERYALISEFSDKVNRSSLNVFNYQTYKNKYSELISQKVNDFEEWENFLKKFLSTVIKDACVFLISYARKNKNIKENFNEEIKKLEEIKKKVDVNNLKYEDLARLKVDMDDIGKNIQEKVTFCEKERFWRIFWGVISFIGGIFITLIVSLIMKKYGYC